MDVEGMDDLEEFGLVKAALSALAVEEPTQLEILKIIAGLLHLGQVRRSCSPALALTVLFRTCLYVGGVTVRGARPSG